MNFVLAALIVTYPYGYFGAGASSASDAGMMLEKGVFALEYNPAGLAWVDSIEVGVAAEGLFTYNLVGVLYKYLSWPVGVSFHRSNRSAGFSLGAAHLLYPLALGGAFTACFDTVSDTQSLCLRGGLQWREYVGTSLIPILRIGQDDLDFKVMLEAGASIPVIYGLSIPIGGMVEVPSGRFRIGGGATYEPFRWLRVQTVVTTDDWQAGVLIQGDYDRGGLWVRKGFSDTEPWQFGISYTRSIQPQKISEVVVYRNLPARVDTVYLAEERPARDTVRSSVPAEARRRQEQLMAKANQLYTAQRYEEALETWREVVRLDPTSDLAARAREDIEDVTALIETLERIRSGRNDKPR